MTGLAPGGVAASRGGVARPIRRGTGPGRRDLAALLACADRALHQAKAPGRDRFEVAEPVAVAAAT